MSRAVDAAAEAARHAEHARTRFEALYERWPSWEVGHPQPAIEALAAANLIEGTVLEAGCGTGENSLHLASLGLEVYGIDVAPSAVGMARAKAAARGYPPARFLVGDALRLELLGLLFDTIIDSGLLHALDDDERRLYVHSLGRALRPGGLFHVLCFSDREPGDSGPRRIGAAELQASFAAGWELRALDETRFCTRTHQARALLGTFRRH